MKKNKDWNLHSVEIDGEKILTEGAETEKVLCSEKRPYWYHNGETWEIRTSVVSVIQKTEENSLSRVFDAVDLIFGDTQWDVERVKENSICHGNPDNMDYAEPEGTKMQGFHVPGVMFDEAVNKPTDYEYHIHSGTLDTKDIKPMNIKGENVFFNDNEKRMHRKRAILEGRKRSK